MNELIQKSLCSSVKPDASLVWIGSRRQSSPSLPLMKLAMNGPASDLYFSQDNKITRSLHPVRPNESRNL